MEWDFRDLSTGEPADPLAGTVPYVELAEEHKVRYVLKTSKGLIILRPMPLRMKRMIDAVRHILYPGTKALEEEAKRLLPYFEGIPEDEVDPDARARLQEITAQLQVTDMGAMGVIVAPAIGSMDDYERLYESLGEDDRMKLASAVRDLSAPIPPERVDSTALEIAKANGLTLMDQEMLDMLTVSQAAFWTDRIAREARRTEAMVARIQRR